MIFKKIKENYFYVILSVFSFMNISLVNNLFSYKRVMFFSMLAMTIILSFLNVKKIKVIFFYFIHLNNNNISSKISGTVSLISWLLFCVSFLFLNIGFIWLARWSFLFFVATVLISSVFIFYEAWGENNVVLKKTMPVFFSGITMLYFLTSTYAASYLLEIGNINISDSPLLELGCKIVFFSVWVFVFLQPISYFVFLYVSNNSKDHRMMVFLAMLFVSSLLPLLFSNWANNFLVFSLDWSTSHEWHTNAVCGDLNIKKPTERYFGFNTDKYTVYFSNRDDKWGFEEINCIKDSQGKDSFKRIIVSQSEMPKWFKN